MGTFNNFVNFHKRTLLTLSLILVFIWSLFSVHWGEDLLHPGGEGILLQMVTSLFHPDLSTEILNVAITSLFRTLAYAVAGMTLAILIAILGGILASGVLTKKESTSVISKGVFRGLLSFMRSIHELVWAWLFVAAIGLSPFAAIFALAIPYGGILGRIFADILNDVPKAPIKALKSSGASQLQLLYYGYFPIAKVDMISYTQYRFECAVRSSTIMSFVGLGGLGYQIQLSLADLAFNQVWTYLFFLMGLVISIDLWSNILRKKLVEGIRVQTSFSFFQFSCLLALLLIFTSWLFIFIVDHADLFSLFSDKNIYFTKKFLKTLLGIEESNPAFINPQKWKHALELTYETLQMSVMAIGFASIGMLFTIMAAARNTADGTLTLSKKGYRWILFWINRSLFVFSRAVPELVWAMIIIFIFKPGILPGAIALALHNFGILGKLCAEVVEDLDLRPIRNLASCGASPSQILIYGIIPTVLPKFITFILYRWEVIIRTTIVVGFIGAGGLGLEFKLSMSWFHYSDITLILICYITLGTLADLLSEGVRKMVR